jgi:hypothetical protein
MEHKVAYFFTSPEERGDTMHIELRIDGVTFIDSKLDFRSLITHLEAADEIGPWASDPLTTDQAKDLLSRLDPKQLELVRQIVLRGGSIAMPEIAKVCGITTGDLDTFASYWLLPINRIVETIRGGASCTLIAWKPDRPDWGNEACQDIKYYIDGPALQSLTKALLV